MELISGFLLWLLVDVFGIKTIRKESNATRKTLLILTFLVVGVFGVMLYFTIFY